MPGGPLAHICFVVRDLDKAVADWTTILRELDPAELSEPVVRVDRWEAGGDVMSCRVTSPASRAAVPSRRS